MTASQLSFFHNGTFGAQPPRARRTDPVTSHIAAGMNADGRESHRVAIFTHVRKNPGQCSAEIAEATGIERHETSRRLADLEHSGVVRKGAKRISTVGMTPQVTWYATEPKP